MGNKQVRGECVYTYVQLMNHVVLQKEEEDKIAEKKKRQNSSGGLDHE